MYGNLFVVNADPRCLKVFMEYGCIFWYLIVSILRSQDLNILVNFAADFVIKNYLLIRWSSFLKPKGFFFLLLMK